MRRLLRITLFAATLSASSAVMLPTLQAAADDHPRYRDVDRNDDHQWTEKEEKAYQKWMKERKKANRKFDKLNSKEQKEYWEWRHKHPDDSDK